MSSEQPPPQPPEFFLERSLGKLTADGLRALGWTVHTIHEHFPDDGEDVTDQEWIQFGTDRGWICLTKDKRIRYRAHEIGALNAGHLFCLADGNVRVAEMVARLGAARDAILAGAASRGCGFWHVHEAGRVRLLWPRA